MSASDQAGLFYVSGAVQGVGYRFFVLRVAQRIGVSGYVKNLADGRVEVYAIGTGTQLATLRDELRRGPQWASVSDIAMQEAAVQPRYATGFVIEHETW